MINNLHSARMKKFGKAIIHVDKGNRVRVYIELCCSFEEGKSDKEILDNLLLSTRYDKRLLPPVQGTLRPPPHTRQDDYTPDLESNDPDHPEHLVHHRHRYHHTAPHNHSSLLNPRQKGILCKIVLFTSQIIKERER